MDYRGNDDQFLNSTPPKNTTLGWPALLDLGLSSQDIHLRRSFLGGSDANVIMSSDQDRILNLWKFKRGLIAADDLNGNLAVMIGSWTEAFNRQWFERKTSLQVTNAGALFSCGEHPWRRATVDGIVEEKASLWEAKHTSAFSKPEDVLTRYMPQLQHGMAVTGLENATLSVIYGNHRYEIYEVAADWLYQDALFAAERHFWDCVTSGEEPVAARPVAPPKPVAYREVCFEGHNSWAIAAWDWLDTVGAARSHANAVSSIKDMIEIDVSRAFGHGIEAKRSKSGAVTIRRLVA